MSILKGYGDTLEAHRAAEARGAGTPDKAITVSTLPVCSIVLHQLDRYTDLMWL